MPSLEYYIDRLTCIAEGVTIRSTQNTYDQLIHIISMLEKENKPTPPTNTPSSR